MSGSPVEALACLSCALGLWMCGLGLAGAQVRALALQGAAIAGICFFLGASEHRLHYFVLGSVLLLIKVIAIPAFLLWAASRLGVQRDKGYYVGPAVSLLAGCVAVALGATLGQTLAIDGIPPLPGEMGLALLFLGMLLMVTRRLALGQLIGLLTIENGILLYGLTQTRGVPLIVEMGAAFEILVAVLIAGIIFFRLSRSFEHIDVTALKELRR